MSYKLVLKHNDAVVSEIPLQKEQTVIGRKTDSDVVVDNPVVSGKHARIIKIGTKIIFEDLKSTNGTIVNGQTATKLLLKHGDCIQIGEHSITLIDPDGPEIPTKAEVHEQESEKTMIISPKARAEMMAKAGVGANSASSNEMPLGAIQVIAGPEAGKAMDLTASLTSIGKGDNCRIKVNGFLIGKQAAAITRRPNGYHFAYIEGMSKPKLNGETVDSQPQTLKDGDIIELGDMKMEFFIKEG